MTDTPPSVSDAVCAVTPGGMRHKADWNAGCGCLCHGLAFCEKHFDLMHGNPLQGGSDA